MQRYKILITNDDGIESPSIQSLITEFSSNFDITVVDSNLTVTSHHDITFHWES